MPPTLGNLVVPPRAGAVPVKRPRSSSIVSVSEIPENYDDTLDSGALYNVNADWINFKGQSSSSSSENKNLLEILKWSFAAMRSNELEKLGLE